MRAPQGAVRGSNQVQRLGGGYRSIPWVQASNTVDGGGAQGADWAASIGAFHGRRRPKPEVALEQGADGGLISQGDRPTELKVIASELKVIAFDECSRAAELAVAVKVDEATRRDERLARRVLLLLESRPLQSVEQSPNARPALVRDVGVYRVGKGGEDCI